MKPTRVVRRARKKAEEPVADDVSEVEEVPAAPLPGQDPVREPTIDAGALEQLAAMDDDAFARAMAGLAPPPSRRQLAPGDEVEGHIVGFSDTDAFIDIGAKSEASIAREDIGDAALGDSVTATVLEITSRGVRIGKRLRGGDALLHLEAAMASGVPVEGRVVERNKGGFVVAIGSLRAFCPVSRIAVRPGDDLDAWLGRTLDFRVVELDGRDVVLDRRAIAEEEEKEQALALWRELAPGQRRNGVVESLHDFGLFVDLGGVRGLVPRGELGEETPPAGEEVEVRVVRVDQARERVTLALRGERPVGDGPAVSLGSMAEAFARAKTRKS